MRISLTYMMPMDNLHDRIRKSRIRQGMSQASLAKQTGVSQPTVANWESGSHVPRKAALERIGTALNVDSLWLLSGDQAGITAYEYLDKPIRHLRIFDWPQLGQSIQDCAVIGYLPFPAERSELFALSEPDSRSAVRRLFVVSPAMTARAESRPAIVETKSGMEILPAGQSIKDSVWIGEIISEISLY